MARTRKRTGLPRPSGLSSRTPWRPPGGDHRPNAPDRHGHGSRWQAGTPKPAGRMSRPCAPTGTSLVASGPPQLTRMRQQNRSAAPGPRPHEVGDPAQRRRQPAGGPIRARQVEDSTPTIQDAGPKTLIDRVRGAERSDQCAARWPRGKIFDDATVAYCDAFSRHPTETLINSRPARTPMGMVASACTASCTAGGLPACQQAPGSNGTCQ